MKNKTQRRFIIIILLITLIGASLLNNSIASSQSSRTSVGIEWMQDGDKIIVAYNAKGIELIDSSTHQIIYSIQDPFNNTHLALSPDGSMFAVAHMAIHLFDPATGSLLSRLPGGSQVNDIAWHPDSTLLAIAAQDGLGSTATYHISILNVETEEVEMKFIRPVSSYDRIAWHPDGTKLAIINSRQAPEILDITTGTSTYLPATEEGYTTHLDWRPDGQQIVTSHGALVRVWDTETLELLESVDLEDRGGGAIRWNPDGTMVAIRIYDGVLVWDIENNALIELATPEYGGLEALAWSPDGSKIAYDDGEAIRIIDAPIE